MATTHFQSTIIILFFISQLKYQWIFRAGRVESHMLLRMIIRINACHLGIYSFLKSFIGSAKQMKNENKHD